VSSKVVIVVGVSGVGKTTVLKELEKFARSKNVNISVINVGTMMLEVAKSKNIANDRDKIRSLSIETQKELRKVSYATIAKIINTSELVVIDTHYLVKTSKGYLIGLPKEFLDLLCPSSFVILEAPPEEIVERRRMDKDRVREEASLEEIELEQSITRYSVFTLAALYNANVLRIINNRGEQREVARKLFEFLIEGKSTKC